MTDVFRIIVKYRRKIIARYRHLSASGNRAKEKALSNPCTLLMKFNDQKARTNVDIIV